MSHKKPSAPSYSESPESRKLKQLLYEQQSAFSKVPYEDWVSRFTVPESPLATSAQSKLTGLMGEDYQPTSYADYQKRFTPTETPLMTGALDKYKGLMGEDYSMKDYTDTENKYLESVLSRYGDVREKGRERLQESLIGENLLGSGPGYGLLNEFGQETARGTGDITKEWAYEGIQRKQQQQQYLDALKRGDYQTMYNLALSEQQREVQPKLQATESANMEKQYYDALQRGDIETAFNMAQILRANQLYPIEKATGTQLGLLGSLGQTTGQFTQEDLARYQSAMNQYNAQLKNKGSLGALGGLVGAGLLGGTALLTGGTGIPWLSSSLTGGQLATIGGLGGYGIGSLFQ